MMGKSALVAAAVAAAALAAPAVASATTVQPLAFSCSSSYGTAHVYSADWLKIHTQHSLSSAVVGQIPRGAAFCILRNAVYQDGHYWQYGYGYNGSTKLTGWAVTDYFIYP
jgi:opacity protein-like surface antigen